MRYAVEVMTATGWTTERKLKDAVQGVLDRYAKAGWRLHTMTNVTGFGGLSGAAIGPFLLLVFAAGN